MFGLGNAVFRGWIGNNLPGSGNEFVASVYLDHMCWVSKVWCFRLGNAVFGGWMVDCWNVIFSNATKTSCNNNPQGSGNKLVEMGHLDQLCWFLKTWCARIGRLGFRCWLGDFWKSVIFKIIVLGGNVILMEYMVNILNELVRYRVNCLHKFLHFIIRILLYGVNQSLVGINRSSHDQELVIKTWHIEKWNLCVCSVIGLC